MGLNGQDITDTPTEFASGAAVSGVQIVLTKKVSALSGAVTDAAGKPLLDASIVVFPANEKLWAFSRGSSARLGPTRTATTACRGSLRQRTT